MPGIEDPKANVLNLVFQWLSSDKSGDWLLILVNADDKNVFFSPLASAAAQTSGTSIEPPHLSRYLPQTGTGSILITSRDRGTAIGLTGTEKQVLRVGIISKDDTHKLLDKKLPDDLSDTTAKQHLIAELDYIPLAITQASAYIAVQGPGMTVTKYLRLLRQDEKNLIHLLSENEVDLRRDPGVPNSVIRSWHISFSQIKERKTAPADLLSRMCFLDRQGIPELLFCEDDEPSLGFEEAVGILVQFSFVTKEKEQKTLSIHRLVQLAIRTWIETYGEVERVQEEVLSLIWRHYPDGKYENWRKCEALDPHAQTVLGYTYNSSRSELQQASIFHNNAWYIMMQGKFKASEEKVQKAISIQRSHLDLDHPGNLASLSLLATIYQNQGRWDEAEKLQVQVIEISKRVLKADHPNVLTSMKNLAGIYQNQGRWDDAEKLQVQLIETKKRVLKVDHPNTLTSMANLAVTYSNQGRWDEAEKLQVQVMEISKRVLKVDHSNTLASIANLAATYRNQGRWDEAEKLQVQVMEISKKVFEVDHPNTLLSIANLTATYWNQGRWDEAEKLQVQVMETRKRVFKADHPDTLISMANLAATYWHQRRWDEAFNLMRSVVEIREKTIGKNHPDTVKLIGLLEQWFGL